MFGGNPNHYYDWATNQEREADTSAYKARVSAADQQQSACSHEYQSQQVYAGHFENVCTKCGKKNSKPCSCLS